MSRTTFEPWVYAWPQSAVAGEQVGIHAAGPPGTAQVEVARVGAERQVVSTAEIELVSHEVPDDVVTAGCGWPAATHVEVDPAWPSGYYEVVVRTDVGAWHEAVGYFVVRATTADPTRPLLVLSTSTWNAYNDFGGANLYTTFGRPVAETHAAFDRPLARGLLRRPAGPGSRVAVQDPPEPTMSTHLEYMLGHTFTEWVGSAGWAGWELPFVAWAETAGYQLDYATSTDLALIPDLLEGRRVYLSVGHDEYWSWEMRDAVESFTAAGGNALFLSGNTSCWQVRFDDDGRTMVGYKERFEEDPVLGTGDERRLTSLWSDHLIGRPENQMTGVSFTRGGYHRIGSNVASGAGGYTVVRPDHWVFEGTGATYGDLIGAESVVVGYECDGCELELRDGLPHPTGADGTPADFQVLGLAPARPMDHDTAVRPAEEGGRSEAEHIAWRVLGDPDRAAARKLRHGHAVMGVHEPGGFVFTSGCTEWAWGLAGADPVIERITRNLLDRSLAS